jgi:protein-disulfide isomerase
MRISRAALVIAVIGLLLAVAGCSEQVVGAARPDHTPAPLAVARDGYGIVAGFEEAPAQIEIYTEPQCTHCHDLQEEFGDQLAYNIAVGRLQVTYRPMTFLDDDGGDYSAKVANALFLATEVVGHAATSGTQFQRYVEALWANQDPGGPAFTGKQLKDMAVGAGVPAAVAEHIASDEEAVDARDMEDTNFGFLYDVDPGQTGTPTVYDLRAGQKIDIRDEDWLDKLVES